MWRKRKKWQVLRSLIQERNLPQILIWWKRKMVGSSESWRWGCQECNLLQIMTWLKNEKGRCSNACEWQARLSQFQLEIALPHWPRHCKDIWYESLYDPYEMGLMLWYYLDHPERMIAGFATMMMMSRKVEVEGTDNLPMTGDWWSDLNEFR